MPRECGAWDSSRAGLDLLEEGLSSGSEGVGRMQRALDEALAGIAAEDDARDAVPAVLDMLRQPDPKLAVVIYGQGGRRADLHGYSSFM